MAITRVAVVQASTRPFDPNGAIDVVETWTARASSEGAQLVVLPESFVGGYPKGSSFGSVVGNRSLEGREAYRAYFEASIQIPGPESDRLGEIARQYGVHLVVGVIERVGSTLYCSVLTFASDGTLLAKRRKLMGVGTERLIFGWGDGSSLKVQDTPVGRIGVLMCWENLMPAARLALYGQGVQIYCAPNAVGADIDVATLRHTGREGRCFVLAAHLFMRPSDFPDDYAPLQGEAAELVGSRGGSCIVGPNGELMAGPVWDEESLLLADLDLDEIIRWKFDFDVTGHFARADLFQLTIRESQHPAVVYSLESTSPITAHHDQDISDTQGAGHAQKLLIPNNNQKRDHG